MDQEQKIKDLQAKLDSLSLYSRMIAGLSMKLISDIKETPTFREKLKYGHVHKILDAGHDEIGNLIEKIQWKKESPLSTLINNLYETIKDEFDQESQPFIKAKFDKFIKDNS